MSKVKLEVGHAPVCSYSDLSLKSKVCACVLTRTERHDLRAILSLWFQKKLVVSESNKDHAVYSDFFTSKRKRKSEVYRAVCVQYVAVSCRMSAEQSQRASSARCL
jgi:hypothetical protein